MGELIAYGHGEAGGVLTLAPREAAIGLAGAALPEPEGWSQPGQLCSGESQEACEKIKGTHPDLTAASCPTGFFCAAVGYEGAVFTTRSEGKAAAGERWQLERTPAGPSPLLGLSCGSPGFCVASDEEGNALTYGASGGNGYLWAETAPIEPEGTHEVRWIIHLSCSGEGYCLAVDSAGRAIRRLPGTAGWEKPVEIDPKQLLAAVSCSPPLFCVAVDDIGRAFTYTDQSVSQPGTWGPPQQIDAAAAGEPAPSGEDPLLTAVSCTSESFCVAVDRAGNALIYASGGSPPPPEGPPPPPPPPGGTPHTVGSPPPTVETETGPIEVGKPRGNDRTGEIESQYEFTEAGEAEEEGIVIEGSGKGPLWPCKRCGERGEHPEEPIYGEAEGLPARPPGGPPAGWPPLQRPFARAAAHRKRRHRGSARTRCRKRYIRKAGRCLKEEPVLYGKTRLTVSGRGRYRLLLKPTRRVLVALKDGERLKVRLTFTFKGRGQPSRWCGGGPSPSPSPPGTSATAAGRPGAGKGHRRRGGGRSRGQTARSGDGRAERRSAGGDRRKRLRDPIDGQVAEAEQVVVAEPHHPLPVDDHHAPPGAEQRVADAVEGGNLAVRIGQQRHGQAVALLEPPVGVEAAAGDPDDHRAKPGEPLPVVPVGAELPGADRRFVAGVEEQHNRLAPLLGEAEPPLGALQLEVGRGVANLYFPGHLRQHIGVARTAARRFALAAAACLAVGCASARANHPPFGRAAALAPQLLNWPQFGLNAQRLAATGASPGITAANLGGLREIEVHLAGTIDSSPLVLGAARVLGRTRTVVIATSTYGRTFAIEATTGRLLWTYTPPDYRSYAGTTQLTNASPLVVPGEPYVYAPDPDGRIRKLRLQDGSEVGGGFPVAVTRYHQREKLSSALNAVGPYLLATTGGFYGDIPPYQGHLVVIERRTGRIVAVFNTLCANRRALLYPPSCPASDSAIWSRAGAVVLPGGRQVVVVTGNGPYNGTTEFGDSALLLSLPKLRLLGSYTPTDQAHLAEADLDLGSGGPALLSAREVLLGGKDGLLRVVTLRRLHRRGLGGELQRLPTPGGAPLLSQPAVWHHGGSTTVFIADQAGTAAYRLVAGRLVKLWENGIPGTSPVFAGSLLYVPNPLAGGLNVYSPSSPSPLRTLPTGPGHFNSPAVADGVLAVPEGDGNDLRQSGGLRLFVAP